MTGVERAWAMRSSRDSEEHRTFIRAELSEGRLRQGWGRSPEQDLRRVRNRIENPTVGWAGISQDEQWAWGHWKMLGEDSASPESAMLVGDVVLVPNVPQDGFFTLCRITGPYDYTIDATMEDFGHRRPVEIITPDGVVYNHLLVSADLRRSLRCRSRLWWIGNHAATLGELVTKAEAGQRADLRQGMDHALRARTKVAEEIRVSLDGLAKAIEGPLRATLQSAEWEPVIRAALVPLLRDVQVIHTGGPNEQGADIEIHVPNPFDPEEPWIIAVQVKDYTGKVGAHVADQLEQAITTRLGEEAQGRLVAVVLASISAEPTTELNQAIETLSRKYGVSISCVHGGGLMRVLARGLFTGYRDLPHDGKLF